MMDLSCVRFHNFPPMMTVKETAECLGICTKTVCVMIRHGDITAAKIGRQYLISKESLKEYCKRGEG
ncbi:MAG: helix-turn-helix domain-containing protein [Clostridiales bacterium]|nr:helix-turn-helix domain-containing protein [Clostridiales bacterium]